MRYLILLLFKFRGWAYLLIAGGLAYQVEKAHQSGTLIELAGVLGKNPTIISLFALDQETFAPAMLASPLRWAVWGGVMLLVLLSLVRLGVATARRLSLGPRVALAATVVFSVMLALNAAGHLTPHEQVTLEVTAATEPISKPGNETAVMTSPRPKPRPQVPPSTSYASRPPGLPQQQLVVIALVPEPQNVAIIVPSAFMVAPETGTVTPAAYPSAADPEPGFTLVTSAAVPVPDVSSTSDLADAIPAIDDGLDAIARMPLSFDAPVSWSIASDKADPLITASLPSAVGPEPSFEPAAGPPYPALDVSEAPVIAGGIRARDVVVARTSVPSPTIPPLSGTSESAVTNPAGREVVATIPSAQPLDPRLVHEGADSIPSPLSQPALATVPPTSAAEPDLVEVIVAGVPSEPQVLTPPQDPEILLSTTSNPAAGPDAGADDVSNAFAPTVAEQVPEPAPEAEMDLVTQAKTSFGIAVAGIGTLGNELTSSLASPRTQLLVMIAAALLALVALGLAAAVFRAMTKRRARDYDPRIGRVKLDGVEEIRWAKLADDAHATP